MHCWRHFHHLEMNHSRDLPVGNAARRESAQFTTHSLAKVEGDKKFAGLKCGP